MNSDLTPEKLRAHIGHDIVIVTYYGANVALECETCGEVLADADCNIGSTTCPNCGGPEGYGPSGHAVGCPHHPKGPFPIKL